LLLLVELEGFTNLELREDLEARDWNRVAAEEMQHKVILEVKGHLLGDAIVLGVFMLLHGREVGL